MSFKKLLYIPIISAATLSPLIVASCSKLPTSPITKPDQVDLLKTEQAKIALLDSWLSNTYSSLWAKSIVDDPNNKGEIEKLSNSILYYLNNLKFSPTKEDVLNGKKVELIQYDDPKYQQHFVTFEQEFKNAYKFYISFKSQISETDSKISPSLYFINKKQEWIKNKYSSNLGLDLLDFKPTLNYGLDGQINDDDFKILISTRGTKIFQEVLKMLLGNSYFTNNNLEMIKKGTNYNKMTKDKYSLNYYNTLAIAEANKKDSNDKSEPNYKTFLLKKYLLDNSPSFNWSYTSEDYNKNSTTSSFVSEHSQFNGLKTTKETKLNSIIFDGSFDELNKLEAYKNLSNSSSSDDNSTSNGDLSNDIEAIKTFGYSKYGLLNTKTNKLFSFSDFKAVKKAIELKLSLPSINIKSDASKQTFEIGVEHLEIKGNNWSKVDGTNDTYQNQNNNQKLIIRSVSFNPIKNDDQNIYVSFTYTFNDEVLNATFNIQNWNKDDNQLINDLKDGFSFEQLKEDQIGINIFDESGNSTGLNYYLRVLPLFEQISEKQIGNDDQHYMIGNFTFKNTPWEEKEKQTKLIYFLMLSNNDIYTQVQNFYLFNDFNIQDSVMDLSIVSDLGLTKKTDSDRRQEGIIY